MNIEEKNALLNALQAIVSQIDGCKQTVEMLKINGEIPDQLRVAERRIILASMALEKQPLTVMQD